MSILYQVVFATRCTSNHHRLALDALTQLQGPMAERWRMLFLHHHEAYLEGAKAPDTVFKDFKNHVLHVREGEWGGAIEAAGEWARRTDRALKAGEWRQAVYNAGVLSHYVVDPIQPFHTGQTEEEGVIHAAVERSFSKSYKDLRLILEVDQGGWPKVELAPGADWLAQAIRAGAHASNRHYELILDHYDHAVGLKDPKAALDQEIKDTVASLIGLAVSTLARVLDRLIEESNATPPVVDGTLDVVFAAMRAPIGAIEKKLEDAGMAALVRRQYEEFTKRGKVVATLSEDDATVRKLHCVEVLKRELSSLDAQWPKEVGLAAGQGAPARVTERPKPPKKVKAAKPAKPKREKPVRATKPLASSDVAEPIKTAPVKRSRSGPVGLSGDDAVVAAPSIGPKTSARLEAVGVTTVADLLGADAERLSKAIGARHIDAPKIREWQDQALLACALPGLHSREAQTLTACGVRSLPDLAGTDLETLMDLAETFVESQAGQALWGEEGPDRARFERWIETAKAAAEPMEGKARSDAA